MRSYHVSGRDAHWRAGMPRLSTLRYLLYTRGGAWRASDADSPVCDVDAATCVAAFFPDSKRDIPCRKNTRHRSRRDTF